MEISSHAARDLFGSLRRHLAHDFADLSPRHLLLELECDALPDAFQGGIEQLLRVEGRPEALCGVCDAVKCGGNRGHCDIRGFRHMARVEPDSRPFKCGLDVAVDVPYGSRIGSRRRNNYCGDAVRLTLTGPSPSSRSQTKTGRTTRLSHRAPTLTTRL